MKETGAVATQEGISPTELMIHFAPLVKTLAASLRTCLPPFVDVEDLESAGMFGLCQAARNYDSGKAVEFGAYARYRIRGAMLDSLRSLDPVPREARKWRRKAEPIIQDLMLRLHRYPYEDEVAEALGLPLAKWQDIRRQSDVRIQHFEWASSDEEGASGAGGQRVASPAEPPAGPETRADLMVLCKAQHGALSDALRKLSRRHRKVICLHYRDQLPLREVGRRIGVGQACASKIHREALTDLGVYFRRKGLTFSAISAGSAA